MSVIPIILAMESVRCAIFPRAKPAGQIYLQAMFVRLPAKLRFLLRTTAIWMKIAMPGIVRLKNGTLPATVRVPAGLLPTTSTPILKQFMLRQVIL